MKTTYILDTSVLVRDPHSFECFDNNIVVIPITALEELDKLKKQSSEAGRNARACIRLLDKISSLGDISAGITLSNDSILKVDTTNYGNDFGNPLYGDTKILACAFNHFKNSIDAVLVTNDIYFRVKAKSMGIPSQGYTKNNAITSDLYSGIKVFNDEKIGLELLQQGNLDTTLGLRQNECCVFLDMNEKVISMGRCIKDKVQFIKKKFPSDLSARNYEQSLAIDLLYDQNLPLVTMLGRAGSGKTLISLAVAIDLVINQHKYDKIVIYRPIQPVGNDIGYLPGEMSEKLDPWFKAIEDNLEVLFKNVKGDKWKTTIDLLKKKGHISFEPLTYIRGRSIPNAVIIADETQNISVSDIKSVLTRVGENTKMILTGDIEQIDNPGLDAINNGLTYVIDKFKDSELAGHVTFTKGERSALATLSSEIL